MAKVTALNAITPIGTDVLYIVDDPAGTALSRKTTVADILAVTHTHTLANISDFGTGVATFLGTPSSANLASAVTDETGSGSLVFATSPTLVTPVLGTPSSGTLTSCTGLPISTGVSGLGTGVATFLATPSSANLASAVTGETGSGALVFATSPTLVTPALGTPSAGVLTNCTGYTGDSSLVTVGTVASGTWQGTAVADGYIASAATWNAKLSDVVSDTTPQLGGALDGQGNDLNNLGVIFLTEQVSAEVDVAGKGQFWVQTATPNLPMFTNDAGTDFQLATLTGTETLSNKTLTTPDIGTPSAGTLTNCTGLPVSSGVSGLGTGVATFLATPSSANLASAVTGETGSGALVFATSPTLVTPVLGTPTSGTLTNCTGLPISTGVSGLGTNVATAAGNNTNAANGLVQLDGSGNLPALNGSALTSVGYAFSADSQTQITPVTSIVLDEATGNEVAFDLSYTVNKATSGNDTGLKLNMTDTASPGTSLLIDAQVGGSTKFSVDKDGMITSSVTDNYIGSAYVSSSSASNAITATVYLNVLANATIADAGDTGSNFTVDNTNKRVTYTGTATRKMHVIISFSMTSSQSTEICRFRLAKNGTTIAATEIERKIGTGSDVGAAAVSGIVSMATNDYIEMFGTLDTSTSDTITVEAANISIFPVGG
jgi:hypothetical protein